MSKDKIADYDGTTAGNNTDIGGISIAEGMLPSAVNNSMRELTKQLGAFANGTDPIDALTVTGAATVNGAFTSRGIDDNADATAITIDSSERVGIGKTPAYTLDIHGVTAIKDSESLTWQGNAQLSSAIVGSGSGATLHFWTSANERMRIQSGGVVSFSTGIELGSALDGTAANTLSDFETGSFTPTWSSGLTSVSYTSQVGRYVKVGTFVHCQVLVDASSATKASSQVKIGGLPFSSANVSGSHGGGMCVSTGGGFDLNAGITFEIQNNDSELIWHSQSGADYAGTSLSDQNAPMKFVFSYITA